ncbi:HutD family protein [Brevibacterium sp. ZH18]|uniref:HutD family protein n=1 Tax=Brevibacterium sp. ZH18 TaxID=2927784 RepID=UPI001F6212F8|nr:HutD family protein [Brevibacterium sp. ZH18]MCI4011013.1 HutD family protein [Brevibacterium sp. ZH18]
MRVITSFDELTPVPWANGAGQTTELVSLEASAVLTPNLRRWRLSIARLERTAPFSPLPGLARTFLPTGAEVVLEIDGHVHRVRPGAPVQFRGEQDVSLIELESPCFAINHMVEDGEGDALEMSTRAAELAQPGHGQARGARRQFALTVESDADHPRFQLIEIEGADDLPNHLGAVFLQ